MDGLGNYESSKFSDAITDLIGTGSSPINVRATVTRKDASGVSWAMVNGKEFPLQGTTVQAQPGESVNVSYDGVSAYSSGNYTDPAIGAEAANGAIRATVSPVYNMAQKSKEEAEKANKIASEAAAVASATNQHFWDDTNGAHVTDVTQDEWHEAEADDFSDASDSKPYHNLLMNSLGILLRTALKNLVSITKSAIAFFDGEGNNASNIVAQFGGSGATIGKSGDLQLMLTNSALALENDTGETVFSVEESVGGTVARLANLVTFADSSTVDTTEYSVSDSLTALGDAAASIEVDGANYPLDSTFATVTVTERTGASVALTSSGVDYVSALLDSSGGQGVLSVEYAITHYDAALMDMDGAVRINGQGGIIRVSNDSWASNDKTDAFITASNSVTGQAISLGVGSGGTNRGVYDTALGKWLIFANANGDIIANADTLNMSGRTSTRINATAPSANKHMDNISGKDKNGDTVFYSQSVYTTERSLYRSFVCQRASANGKTKYQNGFYLHVNNSGNPVVDFTSGAPAAWRNGLGASSGVWPVSLGGTGVTNFGSVVNESGSNVSVATSAWQQLASFSVAPGDWLIIVGCYAASNSTGRRGWYLGTETSASDITLQRLNSAVMSATSGTCYTTIVNRVAVSSATTYRVWGWQNSGAALNMSAYIRRIKLG